MKEERAPGKVGGKRKTNKSEGASAKKIGTTPGERLGGEEANNWGRGNDTSQEGRESWDED